MKKIIFYLLLVAGFLFAVLFFVWQANWYPILNVNGSRIWAGDYLNQLEGFERYRRLSQDEFDEGEVRRGILLSFIADSLVKDELLRRKIPANAAKTLVEEALDTQNKDEFEQATKQLYGWSIRELKEFSLLPQARQDILTEELNKDKEEFNVWLQDHLQNADIKIYFLPYEWQDGELIDK